MTRKSLILRIKTKVKIINYFIENSSREDEFIHKNSNESSKNNKSEEDNNEFGDVAIDQAIDLKNFLNNDINEMQSNNSSSSEKKRFKTKLK